MTTTPGFQRWRHSAPKAETHIVFPDGCRDLLVLRPPCAPVRVLVTELDFLPRRAALDSGVEIEGFRLRPGATISPMALEAIAASPECVETILGDECQRRDSLDDVIMALSEPGATVLSASKRLGISVRTLQRSFLGRALPPPDFWRLLARARRAVGMLRSEMSLAEIADACGFSDQAHMTRDLTRWFGVTPAGLCRRQPTLALLCQPALGNWTGEQISTR